MADPNTEVGLLIADFNRSSLVYLPHDTVRKPGVGLRVTRRRPVSSVWTLNGQGFEMCTPPGSSPPPTPMREIPNARPRFNPFKSKPMSTRPALNRMDLDDENSPAVLSNAPLRMRRNKRFRLGRFWAQAWTFGTLAIICPIPFVSVSVSLCLPFLSWLSLALPDHSRPTFYILHSTFYILHSTFYILHCHYFRTCSHMFWVWVWDSTLCTLVRVIACSVSVWIWMKLVLIKDI
jgi:hypothetical protein